MAILTVTVAIENGIHRVTAAGTIEPGELLETMRALWTEESYSPERPSIYDFRGVTEFDVSTDEVTRAALLSETLHRDVTPGRVALIVGSSTLGFGMARRGQPYSRFQGSNIRVCRNDAEARAWVGGKTAS